MHIILSIRETHTIPKSETNWNRLCARVHDYYYYCSMELLMLNVYACVLFEYFAAKICEFNTLDGRMKQKQMAGTHEI